jgi:hypothetical protein
MVRFAGRFAMMVALQTALLLACGGGSHQPEPPAAVPSPAVQPENKRPAPAPDLKVTPKATPKDSGNGGNYPWPSATVAEL